MSPEIMLVHGWDPDYYNKTVESKRDQAMAWSHRPELINLLSQRYTLKYCNLPGFCGVNEPDKPSFAVEDFADYLEDWKVTNCPHTSLILGYSFGGAISLYHKFKYQDNTPLVLVSPAILRAESARSGIAKVAKNFIPSPLLGILKDAYQRLASDYYREGTPFLRATYDRIVRENLTPIIKEIEPGGVCFIYGEDDQDTPWKLVSDTITTSGHDYFVIPGGGHSIGQTHPTQIIEAIDKFTRG